MSFNISKCSHYNKKDSSKVRCFEKYRVKNSRPWRSGFTHLFLEVVVAEVEDLHRSVCPSHSHSLWVFVKRQSSDRTGQVLEEANAMDLKLTHFYLWTEDNDNLIQTYVYAYTQVYTIYLCANTNTHKRREISQVTERHLWNNIYYYYY